jgi:hypothetical protein
MNTKGKRYIKGYKNEDDYSRNIREMICMIKNERINNGRLNLDKLKVSTHALDRAVEHLECAKHQVLPRVKSILKRATRIGEQLAYDGRINVLFVHKQYAIYLSPNLEYVVTVRKYCQVTYKPIRQRIPELKEKYQGKEFRREMFRLHEQAWAEISEREEKQLKIVMELDRSVVEQMQRLHKLRTAGYSPRHYMKYTSERLKEERERLVAEGEKLFRIKMEKRHIGKSITAVSF